MTTKAFKLDSQLKNDCILITELDLCTVLLMNENQFPWVILVPRRSNTTEICQLNDQEQTQLQKESNLISTTLLREHPGSKLNIANLGNIVSQLHVHHIARFDDDTAWPAPVWGNFTPSPYSTTEIDQKIALWRNWISEKPN